MVSVCELRLVGTGLNLDRDKDMSGEEVSESGRSVSECEGL